MDDDDYNMDMGDKPGLVFCNLDFDGQKEILIFGCHMLHSRIKELKNNSGQYNDPEIGLTVGYYDFEHDGFHFIKVNQTPLYWAVYWKYYMPGYLKAFLAVACVCLSLIFFLIHWAVKGGLALLRKVMKSL